MPIFPTVIRAGFFNSSVRIPQGGRTRPRVVEHYELEVFTESVGVSWVNGVEYPITRGTVILARPGDTRCSTLPVKCLYVHFLCDDPELLGFIKKLPTFSSLERCSPVERQIQELCKSFLSADSFAQQVTAARLVELLWQLHTAVLPAGQVASRNPIQRAVRILQRDYREELTVEALAQRCNLSVSYFHKLFLKETGVTPNRFLMQTRIAAAKSLLVSSSQSVAQIAECCGFSSQGYFCDCMKKYTGMSPKQFRTTANYPK